MKYRRKFLESPNETVIIALSTKYPTSNNSRTYITVEVEAKTRCKICVNNFGDVIGKSLYLCHWCDVMSHSIMLALANYSIRATGHRVEVTRKC